MSAGNDDLGDSPFESVGDEAGEPESTAESPVARLLDGDAPGPAVGELREDYDMPQWMAVMSRGVMRVATGSGVPPIAEIAIGGVMGAMGSDVLDGFGSDDGGDDGDDLPDPDEASPPPLA